jgi:predicted small integral membrane protein
MSLLSFARSRWRCQVPVRRLLYIDMLVWGSIINVLGSMAALALVVAHAAPAIAVAMHVAAWPYNAFLAAALWRHPSASTGQVIVGCLWFVMASLV